MEKEGAKRADGRPERDDPPRADGLIVRLFRGVMGGLLRALFGAVLDVFRGSFRAKPPPKD